MNKARTQLARFLPRPFCALNCARRMPSLVSEEMLPPPLPSILRAMVSSRTIHYLLAFANFALLFPANNFGNGRTHFEMICRGPFSVASSFIQKLCDIVARVY